jgi:hypothetical protein
MRTESLHATVENFRKRDFAPQRQWPELHGQALAARFTEVKHRLNNAATRTKSSALDGTRKFQIAGEWVVADAVHIEPVSSDNSLITGRRSEIFNGSHG